MTAADITAIISGVTASLVTLMGMWIAFKLRVMEVQRVADNKVVGEKLQEIHTTTDGNLTRVKDELAESQRALTGVSGGTQELQALVRFLIAKQPDMTPDTVAQAIQQAIQSGKEHGPGQNSVRAGPVQDPNPGHVLGPDGLPVEHGAAIKALVEDTVDKAVPPVVDAAVPPVVGAEVPPAVEKAVSAAFEAERRKGAP